MSEEKILSTFDLIRELEQFRVWSSSKIAKVFRKTEIPGYELAPIGSGGFMHYKNKFFFITNAHVVKTINDGDFIGKIVVPLKDHGKEIVKFIQCELDYELDIAVLEIDQSQAQSDSDKLFIEHQCFEEPTQYLDRCNFVFVHGFPASQTNVESSDRIVVAETTSLPYLSFFKEYHREINLITIHYYKEGNINAYLSPTQLPEADGLSGSLVFSYRYGDIYFPFGLLGVIQMGSLKSETLWLTPIDDVVNFIESAFFV